MIAVNRAGSLAINSDRERLYGNWPLFCLIYLFAFVDINIIKMYVNPLNEMFTKRLDPQLTDDNEVT